MSRCIPASTCNTPEADLAKHEQDKHLHICLKSGELPLLSLQAALPVLKGAFPLTNLPAGLALHASLPCLHLLLLLRQLLGSLLLPYTKVCWPCARRSHMNGPLSTYLRCSGKRKGQRLTIVQKQHSLQLERRFLQWNAMNLHRVRRRAA